MQMWWAELKPYSFFDQQKMNYLLQLTIILIILILIIIIQWLIDLSSHFFSSRMRVECIFSLILAAYFFTPRWESQQWCRRQPEFGYTARPTAEQQASGRWQSSTYCTSSSLSDTKMRLWSWLAARWGALRSQRTRGRRHWMLWKKKSWNHIQIPGSIQTLRLLHILSQLKVSHFSAAFILSHISTNNECGQSFWLCLCSTGAVIHRLEAMLKFFYRKLLLTSSGSFSLRRVFLAAVLLYMLCLRLDPGWIKCSL